MFKSTFIFFIIFILAIPIFAQEKKSLSDLARDPTSSLTAFQVVYRYNSSFHQVPDVNQSTLNRI